MNEENKEKAYKICVISQDMSLNIYSLVKPFINIQSKELEMVD